MSRLPRLYVPGLPQLILQRGNNRTPIFLEDSDYQQYRLHLRDAAREAGVAIHAFALMPDHAHLLITPDNETSAGLMMQRLGRRYVRYFNDRHGRTGTLWEGRYRSTVLEPAQFLIACYRYVELNPIRAGLVQEAAQYPWSSCRHHLGLASETMIADHALYWLLGNTPFERQAAYRSLLEAGSPETELKAIRYAAHRGWMLGAENMTDHDEASNRRGRPLPKGRPRRVVSGNEHGPQRLEIEEKKNET